MYNYVSSVQKPLTWNQFMDMSSRHGIQVPSMRSMWYYSLMLNKRRYVHLVCLLFLHFIPATIVDGTALLLGKRPKYVVSKLSMMIMMMVLVRLFLRIFHQFVSTLTVKIHLSYPHSLLSILSIYIWLLND